MESINDVERLEAKSTEIRRGIIQTTYDCQRTPHPGGALSAADLCTAVYYHAMSLDPDNPDMPDRDRFVLSKGHACLVQYVILADLGFFSSDELKTVRHINSILQGHPTRGKTPGVDMTTGSLGNGLGLGVGMAYHQHLDGAGRRTYVVIGDGEANEGTIWESAIVAASLCLDNLVVIVDQNHLQSGGSTEEISPMPAMADRWRSFGWRTFEIDGHNMKQIIETLDLASDRCGQPTCIIAETTKGKGVSFMENNNAWHQKGLTDAEYSVAMAELGSGLTEDGAVADV